MKVFVFLFSLFLGLTPALAEYRAFELKISKRDAQGKPDPEKFRLVLSTLDPLQYYGYYIVREDEVVQYTRTWMCRGRTDEKPICPDPKQKLSEESATNSESVAPKS